MSPFSSDMKPTTIDTALRRTTIISMPSSTTDRAKARSSRASTSASLAMRSMTTSESATSARPASMVSPDADDVLDVAVDAELGDDPVQRDRDDDRLEGEGDEGGDVEMVRVLHVGLPGDRERQHDRLQGEDMLSSA